jgi:hypothetical protein
MKLLLVLIVLVTLTFAASNWEVLFPDEQWNKFTEKETQIFQGKLVQKTSSEDAAFMQRDNGYLLETKTTTIDVYAPTNSLKQLYVNKLVEIKGKFNSMELEGKMIQEILPSEIRIVE